MSRTYEKRAFGACAQAFVAALSVGLIASCGDDSGGNGGGTDAGGDAGQVESDGATPKDSGPPDSQVPPMDAAMNTSDTGVRDATLVDAGKGVAPALANVQARQVGRGGADLRVDFMGTDADKDIASVGIELFTASGTQIGAGRLIPLGAAITAASGTSFGLFDGMLEGQDTFDKAKITLTDGRGVASEPVEVTVTKQPVLLEGATCDATFVADRCGPGLGCKGTGTPKCSAGEPPTLAEVGYFIDELGGRVLMRGTDPDGDVSSFKIEFFKSDGTPALIDDDNDEATPGKPSFTKTVSAPDTTDFYLRFTPADTFFTDVASVTVTVSDARATNNTSNAKSADRKAAPVKTSGAACDPMPAGFDYCKGTPTAPLVCASTTSGATTTSKCTATNTARMNACNASLTINPTQGKLSVMGKISASLWDPATGCTTGQFSQPDAVVKLALTADTTKVTLSTDFPYTSFDTVMYLMTACGGPPTVFDPRTPDSTDLWCAQDQPEVSGQPINTKAKLELLNLKAGVYYIVVDSFPSDDTTGALFQLEATVE